MPISEWHSVADTLAGISRRVLAGFRQMAISGSPHLPYRLYLTLIAAFTRFKLYLLFRVLKLKILQDAKEANPMDFILLESALVFFCPLLWPNQIF